MVNDTRPSLFEPIYTQYPFSETLPNYALNSPFHPACRPSSRPGGLAALTGVGTSYIGADAIGGGNSFGFAGVSTRTLYPVLGSGGVKCCTGTRNTPPGICPG